YPHYSFFFNYHPPSLTYTLSLHDALPISRVRELRRAGRLRATRAHGDLREGRDCDRALLRFLARHQTQSRGRARGRSSARSQSRSEEHTSELQSRGHLVCRLLLEKKNYHT